LASFVMEFVKNSDDMREEFMDALIENMQNYLVQPFDEGTPKDKDFPLSFGASHSSSSGLSGFSRLKDSESNQVVETLLAVVLQELIGEDGFIRARRRGVEDTFKASTATRLLEYNLELPGHYRAMYQWLKDGFILGTGIVQCLWEYTEQDVIQREFDLVGPGLEIGSEFLASSPAFDDPRIENIDLLDFYPDPSQPVLSRATRCVKRFRMTGFDALREAKNNPDWDEAAVRRAIKDSQSDDSMEQEDMLAFEGLDRPRRRKPVKAYAQMIGYELWGEVPWRLRAGESRWQVITILGGQTVSQRNWFLRRQRLPFYDITINPLSGRFYGLSPLEISRYSQDLADTILSCIADGMVKSTHPPWLVDRNARIRLAKLRKYHPNVPIETDRMDGVKQLDYKPPVGESIGMIQFVKSSIRERAGANNTVQGLGFSGGVPRSASAAAIENQRASVRPNAVAQFIERTSFPELGQGIFSLYQQFLVDSTDLARRIGEQPVPMAIQEIQSDYDIKFVGSRMLLDKRGRVEAMERAASVIGQLPVAPMFPWADFMVRYLRDLDLHELEALVADPQAMMLHSVLSMLSRGGASSANQNGAMSSNPPSGLLPAQVSGGPVV